MGTGVLNQIGSCNIVGNANLYILKIYCFYIHYFQCYHSGDIAAYYNNISGIDAFLSPCLKYASDHVPSASRSTSPIYFGATAGVRLLKYHIVTC